MTRINCIPVSKLIDQHLRAEYREMLRLPNALKKSKSTGKPLAVPMFYKMSAGHMKFFYDKGEYLRKRHDELKKEMNRRGMKTEFSLNLGAFHHYGMMGDWTPGADAMLVNCERLIERINEMDENPRYNRQPISKEQAISMIKEYVK